MPFVASCSRQPGPAAGYAPAVAETIDLQNALRRPPRSIDAAPREAAVAAVFTPSKQLLLMRRAEHPDDPWSGHVSFPGGRVESADADAVAAAIRETREEVGLELRRDELIGPLDPLAAVGGRSGMVIRPFVFEIRREAPALLTNREVASVHWLALSRLLANEGRSQMRWQRQGFDLDLPCVHFDDQRLWGLTLAMIDDLLDRIDGRGTGLDRS